MITEQNESEFHMNERVEQKLAEAYQHIKQHMNDPSVASERNEMCEYCGCWYPNPDEMDYEECLKKPCFRFWLAYVYLKWETAFE